MAERMMADLVCDILQRAIFRRKRPKGVVIHSDRGSQYCSQGYRQLLQQNQLLGYRFFGLILRFCYKDL
jgi:transposase InsO family protein